MSGLANTLPGALQKRIDGALDSEPCGRCGRDHMTKNCPMSEKDGRKGRVWRDMPEIAKAVLMNICRTTKTTCDPQLHFHHVQTQQHRRLPRLLNTRTTVLSLVVLAGEHGFLCHKLHRYYRFMKPLHRDLPNPEHPGEWPQYIPTTLEESIKVRFEYVDSFDADKLREYAFAEPSHADVNFENIARCLNIVISKSFGNQIHKLSSNKFFVKSAQTPLSDNYGVSNQLELIRGYFYSVKNGMGNIILNFNICISAIFRLIGLDEFLYQNNTFAHEPPEKLESILRGKTVYLTLDRTDKDLEKQKILNSEKSRYWRVCEIQPASLGNIENLTFKRPVSLQHGKPVVETVRVIDHLRDGKFYSH